MIQLFLNWTVSKHAIAAGKQSCKIKFAPQMWATRPHLASIFEKLLDQKTFSCLRLISCNRFKNNLLRKCGLLAHTSAAFLKNCCTEKLFICLRLVFCTLFKTKASGENLLPPDAFSIDYDFVKATAYFALVSTSSFSFASKSSSCMLPKSPFFLERTATVFCSTSLSPMVIIYGTFSSTA